jgi:hypothetical protein
MLELNRMKAIRNVFAHAKTDVTFDTPEIAAEVSGFLGNVGMQAVLKTMENPPSLSNKWIFVTIVRTVCAQISEDHQEISGEALFA